jgi:DNA-binding winged helix-turn-helix (wHTH) protein
LISKHPGNGKFKEVNAMPNSQKRAKNNYIIKDCILFVPSRRELVNTSTQQLIKLQVPASQCLELLLAESGKVVSKNALIIQGWGEARRSLVSINSYYQCILHLRKSLAAMTLPDLIITIPKKGLKINDDVSIRQLDGSSELESEKRVATVDEPEGIPGTDIKNMAVTFWKSKAVLIIITAYVVIVTSAAFIYFMPGVKSSVVFSNFVKLNSSSCSIYVSSEFVTFSMISDALKETGLSCNKDDVIFAYTDKTSREISMISCSSHSKSDRDCLSAFIKKKSSDNDKRL